MRTWIFMLLFAVFSTPAPAKDIDSRFEAARTAYDEGRFADAIAIYDALLAAHPRAPELHFNRGNALARLGRIGEAAAAYQRVLLIAPRDADARANLRFLRTSAALPQPRATWSERIIGALSMSEWRRIALSAWWLGAAFLTAGLLIKRLPAIVRKIGGAFLIAAVVASIGWGYWITRGAQPVAFVVAPDIKVLFAPLPDATPHFDAPTGLALRVLETSGEWLRVREQSREGWLPRRAVEIVKLD